jgi:transposase
MILLEVRRMKTDDEVKLLLKHIRKGKSQAVAAAKAGMCESTARKYQQSAKLPSEIKPIRKHRTRENPFAADWAWIESEMKRDPALQANTLFELLADKYPGRYQEGQLRTLQRHIRSWRASDGPEREVMFPQIHEPGRMAQSDFTLMNELEITISRAIFDHLIFHFMLTYSNMEAVHICFSESFEALSEGMEACIWELGGTPLWHRTDNLTAAVIKPLPDGGHEFTDKYQTLLAYYSMEPRANKAGCANQNGDVEQSHHRFKKAVDQALRVRGHRDFANRETYTAFLQALVKKRNLSRSKRIAIERPLLQELPKKPLNLSREFTVRVSRFSLINVLTNHYSVPSRLIGSRVKVRLRAEHLEVYLGTVLVLTLPRMRGRNRQRVDYRHVVWSLLRKPGAFASYCYREELFPTTTFRRAYDIYQEKIPIKADREYVRLLHLAASDSEQDVENALLLLLETETVPDVESVSAIIARPLAIHVPEILKPDLNLAIYDGLLSNGEFLAKSA